MTKVTFEVRDGSIIGFEASGHAMFDKKGSDIVCASISILIIHTINAITELNGEKYELAEDEEEGVIIFRTLTQEKESTQTFLKALKMSLAGIRSEYGKKYLSVIEKEG